MNTCHLKDTPLTPVNSELAVLGSMLLDRSCVASVREVLADGSRFYLTEHQILYDELLSWEAIAPVWDVVALRERLKERRLYEAIGGTEHLGLILENTLACATAVYHAREVHRCWVARQAMGLSRELRRQLHAGCDVTEELNRACRRLTELADGCGQTGGDRLEAVTAATIAPEPLTWFWPNRIPAGMYSFIVGDPGAGKSFLSCYIAAVASTGRPWADGTPVGDPMDVLMFITEDNLARTVVPRLGAHGADLSRIHFCQGVRIGGRSQVFDIERNMTLLIRQIETLDACGLILFDPVTGFMGDVNQNSQSEVRNVLGRICKLAEQKHITILGLSHLNKKVDLDMRHRSIGSVAFNAVPRAVWGVFSMDEGQSTNDDVSDRPSSIDHCQSRKRYFFPIKDNLCVGPQAMEFTIDDGRLCFGRSLSANQLSAALNPDKTPPPRLTKKETAKKLILERLKQGPAESDKLIAAVVANGISEYTVRDARKELRNARKVDCDNSDGTGYMWFIVEPLRE